METKGDAPYEGGAGGKFQKRPVRRAPATPYDRPASAARVSSIARPADSHAGDGARGGRWLSKLVDPASRIVAQGASRLFSSVFRKRLTAPPDASEVNVKSREEVSNVSHIIQNSVFGMKEKNHIDENNAVNNHASDGALQDSGSHIDQTFELGQLLKQKTFTRFEFDRLMELLRSRTVEPSTSKPPFNSQKTEKANILEQEYVKQHPFTDRTILQSAITHDNKDKEKPGPESGNSSRLHAAHKTPVGSLVLGDESLEEQTDSPAEIAKAYMGSRSLYRSPGSLSAQNHVVEEDKILYNNSPYTKKAFDHSVAPISINTSGTPGLAKNSYMTPRIIGKSATYRMPQSPYFKLPLATKVGSPVDQYLWTSSSKWTSTSVIKSDGGQARKRGRSVLDDDISSIGPVRRLRQKCNAMLPSKYSNSSLKYLSSPLTSSHYYKFSNQKLPNLDDKKQSVTELNDAENGTDASTSIMPIPPQSSEMARRILEQLDKVKSSPKGKSSKLKITAEEESPSKLTYNMLHERALRSMEDIDSSKFLTVHGSNQELTSDSHHEGLRISSDEKQARPEENDPSDPSALEVQVIPEVRPAKFVPNVKSSMKSSELLISNASSSAQKKPSFCISIPEDSLDLDDDDYTTKGSVPVTTENRQMEVLSEHESIHSEREKMMKAVEVSKFVPSHASLLETTKDHEKKVFDKPVRPAKNGSMFSPAPTSNNPHQALPNCTTETLTVSSESSAPVKVESSAFKVGFGLEQTHKPSSPSVTADFSSAAGVNSVGRTFTSLTPLGNCNTDKGVKNLLDGDLSKSPGNAAVPIFKTPTSSSLSTSAVSATATAGNGMPSLLSGTSSASIASAMANSGTGVAPEFSTSTTMASSTSSSALTSGSTIPTFQFGSGHSIATPSSATAKSDFLNTEEGSVKLSAFGTSSSIIPGISAAFSNSDGNSSASMSSSAVSSTTTSSLNPAPSFYSSSGTGSSSVSASSAPSGSSNSFFSFGASSQSSGVNLSFPSTNSLTTSKSFGFTAGATLSNQGTQSAGDLHVLQGSANQFGSLSSPTMFGANGSSSSGSSSSLFSSTTFAAKSPGLGAGLAFPTAAVSSSSSESSTSLTPTAFSSSSGISFTTPSSSSTAFGSATPFTSSSSFSFSTGIGSSSGSGSNSSLAASPTNTTFNSSSQTSPSTIFGSLSSSMSAPSTGFSIGSSTSGSSPFTFGASSVPAFSFGATGSAASSAPLPSKPVFGVSNQLSPMNSGSPGNDQMNVEDSMADDPVQAPVNTIPTFGTAFGQPTSAPATPGFVFGSPAVNAAPSTFQFGSQHGSSVPQNTSPFQPNSSLEFAAGGSFSLGSGAGGGDKSGRKFVRVRRDKLRKK